MVISGLRLCWQTVTSSLNPSKPQPKRSQVYFWNCNVKDSCQDLCVILEEKQSILSLRQMKQWISIALLVTVHDLMWITFGRLAFNMSVHPLSYLNRVQRGLIRNLKKFSLYGNFKGREIFDHYGQTCRTLSSSFDLQPNESLNSPVLSRWKIIKKHEETCTKV